MKLVSPLPHRRGRIEIIPLIDIMFFLLAAFMMVSLDMVRVKSLKINLPTDVPAAQKENKEDFISISVKEDGTIGFDKDVLPNKDVLLTRLQQIYATNHDQKFLISADQEARHGDVMRVLGRIRAAGFQKVAFSVKPENVMSPDQAAPDTLPPDTTTPSSSLAPGTSAAPATPGASTEPAAPGTPTAPAPAPDATAAPAAAPAASAPAAPVPDASAPAAPSPAPAAPPSATSPAPAPAGQ